MSSKSLSSERLGYTRSLFEHTLDWYKNGDSKAQVLLALDSALVAFLTGLVLPGPEDLGKIVGRFGMETWLSLGLMYLSFIAYVAVALTCLGSRLEPSDKPPMEDRPGVLVAKKKPYPPEWMWFFQHVSRLYSARFTETLLCIDKEFKIRALANEILKPSQNVVRKHHWVDCGFASTVASVIALMLAIVGYVLRSHA